MLYRLQVLTRLAVWPEVITSKCRIASRSLFGSCPESIRSASTSGSISVLGPAGRDTSAVDVGVQEAVDQAGVPHLHCAPSQFQVSGQLFLVLHYLQLAGGLLAVHHVQQEVE